MKISPGILALFLVAISPLLAEESKSTDPAAATSEEALRTAVKLLEIRKSAVAMVEPMMAAFDAAPLEPELKELMIAEFSKPENIQKLLALIATEMAKEYTQEELNAMTEFYLTPVGQKIASKEGAVATATMKAGTKWGEKLGHEVGEKYARDQKRNQDLR